MMIKTYVFTRLNLSLPKEHPRYAKSKLIFIGEVPFQIRKGDWIGVDREHGTFTVDSVSYDFQNKLQEVIINFVDEIGVFPDLPLDI